MKKLHLAIIFLLSFTASRLVILLVDDLEGPNLLIVTALAGLIFVPVSLLYGHLSKKKQPRP